MKPIYIAHHPPYYHLYTETGIIECPFEIDYYCVKNGTLIGLKDNVGYWHIVAINSDTSTVKIIYENLDNIEDGAYNHIVGRLTNGNQFVYSLKNQDILIPPTCCDGVKLYAEGILIEKDNNDEIYDYSGRKVLSDNLKFSVIKGVKINEKEIILAKNKNNLMGLYSFTGKCILPCNYTDIQINKHYIEKQEFITIDALMPNMNSHTLFHLDPTLQTHHMYFGYSSIKFYDCGRVALATKENESHLLSIKNNKDTLVCVETLKSTKIKPLTEFSTKYFSVWKNKKVGVCNLNGKITVPIKYNRIKVNEWGDKVYASRTIFNFQFVFKLK